MRYVLGNILLTTRYGAVSSRVGRMENEILGVFGGIAELPSSLELVQAVHDRLKASGKPVEHPLNTNELISATKQAISTWINKRGISMQLSEDELNNLIADVDRHLSPNEQENFLKRLDRSYKNFRRSPAEIETKKDKKKKATTTILDEA